MALSINPAGLVYAGHQFQMGASLFAPFRGYNSPLGGGGFVAEGSIDSRTNYFVMPNIAYSRPIDADSAWGIALFGNGGMNTNYANVANSNCASPPFPATSGVFCAGGTGVDLMQVFLALGYARKVGSWSFGIAPMVAIQRFEAWGLEAFSGASSSPTNLTGRGFDYSYGGGIRAGVQWNVTNAFRIGISGQTPMWMTKFNKYRGLFAEQGGFDIPANITAGIAVDMSPAFTVMFDYKHIWYGSIRSIANPMASPGFLGADNGMGFGWGDVDIFKVGVEWRASPAWTFRAGYSHNTNPIKSPDVTFNILAPGVVTDHFTGGFSYKMSPNWTMEFAGAYVPRNSISGPEIAGGVATGRTITLAMHQYQVTLGLTYQFDVMSAPVIRK